MTQRRCSELRCLLRESESLDKRARQRYVVEAGRGACDPKNSGRRRQWRLRGTNIRRKGQHSVAFRFGPLVAARWLVYNIVRDPAHTTGLHLVIIRFS